jgi:hypothetical protein
MNFSELLPQLTSRGDIGTALVGYAVGFAVDVFGFTGGLDPGTTAGVFAAGAVGAKNGLHAAIDHVRAVYTSRGPTSRGLGVKVENLASLLQEEADNEENPATDRRIYRSQLASLSKQRELWTKGLLDDELMFHEIIYIVERYRGTHSSRSNFDIQNVDAASNEVNLP